MRLLAALLVGFATIAIAIGTPPCCALGLHCCGAPAAKSDAPRCPCCPAKSDAPSPARCKCAEKPHDSAPPTAAPHLDAPTVLFADALPAETAGDVIASVAAATAVGDAPPIARPSLRLPLLL